MQDIQSMCYHVTVEIVLGTLTFLNAVIAENNRVTEMTLDYMMILAKKYLSLRDNQIMLIVS